MGPPGQARGDKNKLLRINSWYFATFLLQSFQTSIFLAFVLSYKLISPASSGGQMLQLVIRGAGTFVRSNTGAYGNTSVTIKHSKQIRLKFTFPTYVLNGTPGPHTFPHL